MVKVGFIVEGDCEKIIIESPQFKQFLLSCGFELVTPVINAAGGGNLLPRNIQAYLDRFNGLDVDQICVLTDLEDEPSISVVTQRICHANIQVVFVAVKALEAWFLADTAALSTWLGQTHVEAFPEQTPAKPWDRLKDLAAQYGCRGTGTSKVQFAKRMVKHYGFRVEAAATHSECPSVQQLCGYFQNSSVVSTPSTSDEDIAFD